VNLLEYSAVPHAILLQCRLAYDFPLCLVAYET
jgi:hypothetical protein